MNVEILETPELHDYLNSGIQCSYNDENYYRKRIYNSLNTFCEKLYESNNKLYVVVVEKLVNFSLPTVDHINMKFRILYFNDEVNKNLFIKAFNNNETLDASGKFYLPFNILQNVVINNVCIFEMRPLDNCCGICISTNYNIYNYLGIRPSIFNEWALEMKKEIAKSFKYSILMLSLRVYQGKRYHSLLKDKLGMNEVLKFRNIRTGNDLAVLTVDLN